jgi:hypothetical protein
LGSARAKARAMTQHPFPIPAVVDYCAAAWLVFHPALTKSWPKSVTEPHLPIW